MIDTEIILISIGVCIILAIASVQLVGVLLDITTAFS